MKILYPPASGRRGTEVFYQGRFGMTSRTYCRPHDPSTPAQEYMRQAFGSYSQQWAGKLSQAQRDRWNAAGAEVWSHPRCGTRGKLTGEQFFTGINSTLACCNMPPLWEPPARVVFNLSPVRQLVITNDEEGVRVFLRLAAAPTEDIMVFGQEPCSAGRSKRRNVSYLGLLPPAEDGLSEITGLYKAKYGEPRPGTKVFIVTSQQKNGWKGFDQETNEVVPQRPEGQQSASTALAQGVPNLAASPVQEVSNAAETGNSQKALMHKGCTRGAGRTATPAASPSPAGIQALARPQKAAVPPLHGGGDGKT